MIDKRTISREIFLPILPKSEELRPLKKSRDKSLQKGQWSERTNFLVAKFLVAFIAIVVLCGFISVCIEASYIDINEWIAASFLIPTKVLEWVREVPLEKYINKVYLPSLVMALFIFLVAKFRKPDKD